MKQYGHTQTLFIQWGKYKWSYKYDHCVQCGTCKFKHKGRWLCTSCHDKERGKTEKRKEVQYKATMKWHNKNYVRIPPEQHKKKWPKPTGFDRKAYQKEWYQKRKEFLDILREWKRLEKEWKILPKYKNHPLPFDIWPMWTQESYEDFKKRKEKFDKIKKFIDTYKI